MPTTPSLTTINIPSTQATSNPGAGIDYRRFLDCVHCGLCTASCPTYLETGDENEGPRGRIHLMRSVTDGRLELSPTVREHLDNCLDCRACETACPSGVQYGRLIEPFRIGMEQQSAMGLGKGPDFFHRWVLFWLFPYPSRLRAALWPARIAQQLGVLRLAQALGMTRLLPATMQSLLSMLPPAKRATPRLPERLPAIGPRRATVALFTGCVADAMFRHTHWATARVLQRNGCDVIIPRTQSCCGAIHYHGGASAPALQCANDNVAAFNLSDVDAVIVNVAGCGAMFKDYSHHWPNDVGQAERIALGNKVKDVHEFLDALGLIPPTGEINRIATYHDACHLAHAQKIREAPRRILQSIPGLILRDLPEGDLCCGAAGTYNLTHPQMSQQLQSRKLTAIESTGASLVLTANAGCLLQITRGATVNRDRFWIGHPMDLLDMSYQGKTPQTDSE